MDTVAYAGTDLKHYFATTDTAQVHLTLAVLCSSGLLAFLLNFSIFLVIQTTSALAFNVAGNAKVR